MTDDKPAKAVQDMLDDMEEQQKRNSAKGTRRVFRDGKWEDGKATPWLPPEQMRGLPEDFTTRDPADADRIHELDAPHIVENLLDEQVKQEQDDPALTADDAIKMHPLWVEPENEPYAPVTQFMVDVIKFRVIRALIDGQTKMMELGRQDEIDWSIRHLWFPDDRLDPRQLRTGRPPGRWDRPGHLKEIDLVVDIANWPRRILDMLEPLGIEVPDIEAMKEELVKPKIIL